MSNTIFPFGNPNITSMKYADFMPDMRFGNLWTGLGGGDLRQGSIDPATGAYVPAERTAPPADGSPALPSSPEGLTGGPLANLLIADKLIAAQERGEERRRANRSEDYKAFEEMMLRVGKQQQKFGLQSNLVGFALGKLPDMMAAGARNRNYYLDNLVAGMPDQRLAAGAFTGAGIPNYSMV